MSNDRRSLFIPALLLGVSRIVALAAERPDQVGVRPGNDGKPLGAWKGKDFFYGVYFAGFQSSYRETQDSFSGSLAVGVDVTRLITTIPTAGMGEWFLKSGELYERAGRVTELLTQGSSAVANSCATALGELTTKAGMTDPGGVYREHFDSAVCNGAREEGPAWIGGHSGNGTPPVIYVVRLTFTGLKFHSSLTEIQQ